MVGNGHLTFWFAILLLAGASSTVLGDPSIALDFSQRPVYVNEPFVLTVRITGSDEVGVPEFPEIENCAIRDMGRTMQSRQIQIVNGQRHVVQLTGFDYELTPLAPGTITIPPVSTVADGKTIRTQPMRIEVRESNADELFFVRIRTGRQHIYVGQRVRLTMTIWVKPPYQRRQRVNPSYVLRRISPINFGPFPREISNSDDVGRTRTVNGEATLYYAFDFETTYIPERPGPLEFSDIQVGVAYPEGQYTRNLRAVAEVHPPIDILPVPQEGRPHNYNGAVGLFDIRTRATPTDVRVGDPIELTIDVLGEGPLEMLPPPLLTSNDALASGFRLPSEPLAGEVVNGRRRFALTIRAKDASVEQIPPIEYPYFDPDAERFVVARSDPIALNVSPGAEISAADVVDVGEGPDAAPAAGVQALDGLRDIETRDAVLLAPSLRVTPSLRASATLAPPVAFVLLWGLVAYYQARTRDPARNRRRSALSAARRSMAAAADQPPSAAAAIIGGAMYQYLADRTNRPAARFIGQAGTEYLRRSGIDDATVARWDETVRRCEEASFGATGGGNPQELVAEADDLLRSLERSKL